MVTLSFFLSQMLANVCLTLFEKCKLFQKFYIVLRSDENLAGNRLLHHL